MNTPAETRHAVLGASSAYRWTACPGSVRLSVGVPRVDNAYSLEGTLAHDWAAAKLTGVRWKGEPVKGQMAKQIYVYVNYVKETAHRKPTWIEQEVHLDGERFGTADAIVWHPEELMLEVIDLKFGAGVVVEVEDNPQLLYYCLAAYRTFKAGGINPRRLRITIVQPRVEHHEGYIRSRDVDVLDLIEWGAWLDERALATKAPDAPLVPGDHCKFCPAKATCPELRKQALAVAQSDFEDTPDFAPPALGTMTLEQMGKVLEQAPILESWLSAVREHVYAQLQRGGEVPGWKLVPKRATRRWKDESAAVKFLNKNLNLSWNEIHHRPEVKSPAQIEKLLEPPFRKMLDEHISKESSGESLAPIADKRAAVVKLSAPDEFNTTE